MTNARKLTAKDVARFKAIRASKAARAAKGDNDNQPAGRGAKSAYVNTTMTPAMLAACVEAAGFAA